MKSKIVLLAAGIILESVKSYCYTVALPPNNLVQNPYFASFMGDWSGSALAFAGNWSTMPNNNCCLAQDIYQDIPTTPGQLYSVSFYAAADLYLAPSVTIDLDINSQMVASWTTPPYQLNGGNRYNSMQWVDYTDTFYATSSTTQLEFVDANTDDFGLTTISMVAAPEPTTPALLVGGGILGLAFRYRGEWRLKSSKF